MKLVAGVGCSLGCPPEELRALVEAHAARRASSSRSRPSIAARRSRACSPRPTHFGVPLQHPRRRGARARSTCRRRQRRRRAPRRHAERRRGRGAARPARALLVPKTRSDARNLRGGRMARVIHPIEVESYRILRVAHRPQPPAAALARGRRAGDPRRRRPVVRRHPGPRRSTRWQQGREALLDGAPVYCDARMAAAGITSRDADRPARRPARQDARPGPHPLRGRDAPGHRRRRPPAPSG